MPAPPSPAQENTMQSENVGTHTWPKLKKAIYDVIIAAELNGRKYIFASELVDKLYEAALSAAEPSVAVKALKAAEEELSRIDCIPMVTETNDSYKQLELAKVYAGRGAHEARKALSALTAQVQDVAGWEPPQACDGKEQIAFETWASGNRYDMHEHPLHYLFMDPKTNAARQGWNAALKYVRDQFAAAPAKQEGKP